MKKLRAIVMEQRKKTLMKGLLRLGCVEIRSLPENEQAQWKTHFTQSRSELAGAREELERARRALQAVEHRSGEKPGMFTPRPGIAEEAFFAGEFSAPAREQVEEISQLLDALEQLEREEERLRARAASLLPWQELELPLEVQAS